MGKLSFAKTILIKSILVAGGVVTAFIALEIILRAFFFITDHRIFGLNPARNNIKFYTNPYFGLALEPNQTGWVMPHTGEYLTYITTNSHGWLDVEHNFEKPSNTFRIVIIGDSFVENTQVPLERSFFRQLESLLRKKTNKNIEVIALGKGNIGTASEYLILKAYGLRYQPDLVIQMLFTGNDIVNNSPDLHNDPYVPYFNLLDDKLRYIPFQPALLPTSPIKQFFKDFEVYKLVIRLRQKTQEASKITSAGYPNEFHTYDKVYNQFFEDSWKVTKKLILKMSEETKAIGAEYILVTHPSAEQVDLSFRNLSSSKYNISLEELDFDKPDRILNVFCQEQSLTCLFPADTYRQFNLHNPTRHTHLQEGHWSGDGTDLMARFLSENIHINKY